MENKTNWQYYGLFLNGETRKYITNLEWIKKDVDKIYLDHCTLLHCSKNTPDNKYILDFCEKNLNKNFKIKIIGFGASEKAIAFKVDLGDIPCANKIPHITIATKNGGKPVDSNFITTWEYFEPFEIEVTLLKK